MPKPNKAAEAQIQIIAAYAYAAAALHKDADAFRNRDDLAATVRESARTHEIRANNAVGDAINLVGFAALSDAARKPGHCTSCAMAAIAACGYLRADFKRLPAGPERLEISEILEDLIQIVGVARVRGWPIDGEVHSINTHARDLNALAARLGFGDIVEASAIHIIQA